jgi:diguanylate cyclase (GGDEF)-like protein/PAS domain S-box-containing protein
MSMLPPDSAGDLGYRRLFDASPRPMWVTELDTDAVLAVNDAAMARYGKEMAPAAEVEVSEPIEFAGRPARLVVASDAPELRRSEERLRFLAENVSDVIFRYRFRPELGFEYISPACEQVTGYTAAEYYASPDLAWQTVHPDDLPSVAALLELRDRVPDSVIVRVRRKDGSLIWTEQRMIPLDGGDSVIGVARDITDRVHLEEQLRMLALDDELTGLRNRRGFLLFGNQLLRVLQRAGGGATLLFLDVDHLKKINDTQGHAAGDAALATVGRALRRTFRDSDVIGRVAGDEFAVLLAADQEGADGERSLLRLRERLAADSPGEPVSITGGLANWTPSAPMSLPALMGEADRAMYRDKHRSRGGVEAGIVPEPAAPRRRILVVDDLEEMRLMMRTALEHVDVEIVGEAADGDGAVRLAEELQPDVVLLDLRMPGSDGFEALPRLRAVAPNACLVVVTVLPPGPETKRAQSLGADHVVGKSDFRSVVELVGAL